MNRTLDSRPVQIDVVLQAHDIDSSSYTFNYVAGWATQAAGPDTSKIDEVIRATGEKVIADARADEVLQPSALVTWAGPRTQVPPTLPPAWEAVTAPTRGSQLALPLLPGDQAVPGPGI